MRKSSVGRCYGFRGYRVRTKPAQVNQPDLFRSDDQTRVVERLHHLSLPLFST